MANRAAKLDADPHSDWQVLQCARISAPPLRFNGQLLHRQSAGRPDLSFELYLRRQGGFTIAMPGFADGRWRQDAMRAKSWSEAFDKVEDYCDRLFAPKPQRAGAEVLLSAHLALVSRRNEVLDAAGRALAAWVELAEAGVTGKAIA
ncbi:MAG: hypothetical protein AAGF88_09175 [Pseudomonadota bacterium]